MEYRDVYTRDGVLRKPGVPKHAPVERGDFFRHVLVILKTADSPEPGKGEGMYIMQQRSLKARYYAGKWDATGGSVRSGESLKEAAVREVREELGLEQDAEDLVPAWEFIAEWGRGSGLLITVFGCRVRVPEHGIDFDQDFISTLDAISTDDVRQFVRDYIDTGNRLTEPLSGQPVLIANAHLMRKVMPENGYRQVAYGSVGGAGTLRCFRPEGVYIDVQGRRRRAPDTWVALFPDKLPGPAQALAPASYILD
jgi:8-oxo-dGTP pyrophosphatase MutT (NUDIX family)